jgi:hypothetical protein
MPEPGVQEERRVAQRRGGVDRRFGERRRPERALAGRRVLYMDRRESDRRVPNLVLLPA